LQNNTELADNKLRRNIFSVEVGGDEEGEGRGKGRRGEVEGELFIRT